MVCWINRVSIHWHFNLSTIIRKFLLELTCLIKKLKKRTNQRQKKIKNVFYGVMSGILILQKSIQKELPKPTKKLLKNLIMMELSFLFKKKILARLKKRTIFASMCLVMKMSWFFQFMFQIKNLKTQWICCF